MRVLAKKKTAKSDSSPTPMGCKRNAHAHPREVVLRSLASVGNQSIKSVERVALGNALRRYGKSFIERSATA